MTDRRTFAEELAKSAGALAMDHYRNLGGLIVEKKGHQDFVTRADREVELHVRAAISDRFPDDAVIGEEHAPTPGTSGHTWVIDPIDGTANFIAQIPAWTVVLAVVSEGQTQIGVIHDPVHDETFSAARGQGAYLNGRRLALSSDLTIRDGAIAIGYSNLASDALTVAMIAQIMGAGGRFFRNASGAISLAYVAAGRLLGYWSDHMQPWDCLAGQLLIEEAGGRNEEPPTSKVLKDGGPVTVAAPGVFDDLIAAAARARASL